MYKLLSPGNVVAGAVHRSSRHRAYNRGLWQRGAYQARRLSRCLDRAAVDEIDRYVRFRARPLSYLSLATRGAMDLETLSLSIKESWVD